MVINIDEKTTHTANPQEVAQESKEVSTKVPEVSETIDKKPEMTGDIQHVAGSSITQTEQSPIVKNPKNPKKSSLQ
ncbi:hypothetical protein NEPAR06_2051 [Nematocida parisii]|nr:hypothetical protein NEPAR06_2051 [Nematocida parisii]KAI5156635.1 hypothetical protein NEPAR05_0702 [Nematocida parisii]